jgi:hypothetical protein
MSVIGQPYLNLVLSWRADLSLDAAVQPHGNNPFAAGYLGQQDGGRVTGKPSVIQCASAGRQFSGRATLEEAERVRHERKPSERFPGACLRITSGLPSTGKLSGCGEFESLPGRKRHDANVNNTGPTKTGRSAIGGLLTSASEDPRAKPPEPLQDSGKGDCTACGCGFRLRTDAENSVITSPIGKG